MKATFPERRSYLSYPRIVFAGRYLTTPCTVNNSRINTFIARNSKNLPEYLKSYKSYGVSGPPFNWLTARVCCVSERCVCVRVRVCV